MRSSARHARRERPSRVLAGLTAAEPNAPRGAGTAAPGPCRPDRSSPAASSLLVDLSGIGMLAAGADVTRTPGRHHAALARRRSRGLPFALGEQHADRPSLALRKER